MENKICLLLFDLFKKVDKNPKTKKGVRIMVNFLFLLAEKIKSRYRSLNFIVEVSNSRFVFVGGRENTPVLLREGTLLSSRGLFEFINNIPVGTIFVFPLGTKEENDIRLVFKHLEIGSYLALVFESDNFDSPIKLLMNLESSLFWKKIQ